MSRLGAVAVLGAVAGLVASPELVMAASWDLPPAAPAPLLGVGLPVIGAIIAAVVALKFFGRKG